MALVAYGLLAYVLCGVARVQEDFSGPLGEQPMWVYGATTKKVVFMGATWPMREVFRMQSSARHAGEWTSRSTALGVAGAFTIWAPMMGWVCLWFWIAGLLLSNVVASAVLGLLFLAVANVFLMPIVAPLYALVMMPVSILLTGAISLVFPARNRASR